MAVTNTGIVERVITGVHDANFVRPLGDEEITNGDFSDGISNWVLVGGGQETVVDGQLILRNTGRVKQLDVVDTNKTYIGKIIISGLTIGSLDFYIGSTDVLTISTNGTHTFLVSNPSDAVIYIYDNGDGWDGSIDSVSAKEVLVSRESTATNTGVVERSITGVHDANFVRPLGDEGIINGDFSNGSTDWSLSNWSITNNVLLADVGGYIYQSDVFEIGKSYKVSINVKDYTSGSLRIDSNGQNNWTPNGPNTTATIYISNLDRTYLLLEGSFRGSIDNVSVKEMLVTRESTATNTGIVERGVTGFNESVAFRQDTRTNLIPYSEDFSDASWTKSRCTVTSNQAISPNGTLNADLMTSTDDDARLEDQVGSSGAEYTQSIYIKSAQVSDVNCQIDFAGLNIVTFTANQQWQRVETTLTDTSISPRLRLRILNSGNSIYVWGGQVEQQSYSTSYIPTSGAAVTVDNNSTSVVNNTGIVERPIVGVNESDEMFPDNTISNIVNIAGLISSLIADLKARATTFENEDVTQEILINLQKC